MSTFWVSTAHPDLFKDSTLKEARKFLRKEVFEPWRIQYAIDTKAVGGLNYGACDTIRAQVEQLNKSEKGVFPSGSCMSTHAKKLELHAASVFNLGSLILQQS